MGPSSKCSPTDRPPTFHKHSSTMSPPENTYRSDLKKQILAAEKEGIDLEAVPAMLKFASLKRPDTYFRDLANSQGIRCKPCTKRGVICEAMNMGGHECYQCIGRPGCDRQACRCLSIT